MNGPGTAVRTSSGDERRRRRQRDAALWAEARQQYIAELIRGGLPVPRTTDWSICPPAGQVVDEVWDFPNGYGLRVFARTIGDLRRDGFYVSLTPWVDGLGLSRDGWTGTLPKFDREWPTQLPSENLRVWEIVEAVSELPDLPNNWWKKSPWKDWGR